MIKIENAQIYGMARAIYSARNAMNSWHLSDSDLDADIVGEKDLDLAMRLVKAGSDHAKFLRMITVIVDITAPLYWLKETDTYKVGTVCNSTSTMHKIHAKEFTLDDFSHEHLYTDTLSPYCPMEMLKEQIKGLNFWRQRYLETGRKEDWWQLIQQLPSTYNQLRTYQLNYEVLRRMYHARKNHRLDEWREFCKWMEEELPYSELITAE